MVVEVRDGGTFRARPGEPVDVQIAQPASGHEWLIESSSAGLDIVQNEYLAPTSTAAGASGQRHIVAVAQGPGTFMLKLALRRAWEPAAAETCDIVVVVE
jgi:predicted secreted protein